MFVRQLPIVLLLFIECAFGQSPAQLQENLSTCLSGRYPSLCKQGWLTDSQRGQVEEAERRENLNTCLTGRYASLCKRSLLTAEEARRVDAAERRENLATCLSGRYRSLCKRHLLTAEEAKRVEEAERRENASTCLSGRYPTLCNRGWLTKEQLAQAEAAERRVAASQPASSPSRSPRGRGRAYSGCEDGHWVDSVSNDGRIVKLEDGSVWEVSAVDAIDSALWLPTTDIIACDDKLINTEDNEAVAARRLR